MTAHEQEYLDQLASAVADKVLAALPDRDSRPLLKLEDVGERLGISERAVRALVNREKGREPRMASVVIGDGARRVEQSEVDRYLDQQRLASRTVMGEDRASTEA